VSKHLRGIILIVLACIAVFFIVEKVVLPQTGDTRLQYKTFYQKLEQ